jgi:hypothetical protein
MLVSLVFLRRTVKVFSILKWSRGDANAKGAAKRIASAGKLG